MRILILSDIHGSIPPILALAEVLAEADLILVAGDITDFGSRSEAAEILGILREPGVPIGTIAGNCDRKGARDLLEEEGVSVEARCRILGGLQVVGAGGGLERNGSTAFERPDDELELSLRTGMGQSVDHQPLVILTHHPPKGGHADLRHGHHAGSIAFGHILAERAPLLWISGHIHESMTVSRKGGTLQVNPGPLHDGYFATADYDAVRGTIEARLRSIA